MKASVVFRTSSVRNQDERVKCMGSESFFSWVGYEVIALLRLYLKSTVHELRNC